MQAKFTSLDEIRAACKVLQGALSRDHLLGVLERFPEHETRLFESGLTLLAASVERVEELLAAVADDEQLSQSTRYAALFALCTLLRRFKNYSPLIRRLRNAEEGLRDRGSFQHLFAIALKARNGPGDLQEAIQRARLAARALPDHPGVLHNYAEALVQAAEDSQLPNDLPNALDRASEMLERAIELESGYAKFYCTRGRLSALRGRFDEAVTAVEKAIDLEDSQRTDYPLRLMDYQAHLLRAKFGASSAQLKQEVTESREQLQEGIEKGTAELRDAVTSFEQTVEQIRNRHIEFLGFFAAIVALAIGGIHLSASYPAQEAIRVLVTLGGVLLVGFSGLGILLDTGRNLRRSILVLILGVALVLSALVLMPLL